MNRTAANTYSPGNSISSAYWRPIAVSSGGTSRFRVPPMLLMMKRKRAMAAEAVSTGTRLITQARQTPIHISPTRYAGRRLRKAQGVGGRKSAPIRKGEANSWRKENHHVMSFIGARPILVQVSLPHLPLVNILLSFPPPPFSSTSHPTSFMPPSHPSPPPVPGSQ